MSTSITTEVLPTHTPALFLAAVARAAELLRAGEVVALPTETVYGLAANALNPAAVAKIYALKGRPAHNPIIVHVDGLAMAQRCVAAWPVGAERLAAAFWPGPLTLVLPRAAAVPDIVTAGGETVGVRWPQHPFIREVTRVCGFPLAAPSANLSNQVSPTSAAHVVKQLGGQVRLVVDGGQAQVGIESTVVDLTGSEWRVLRPGMISVAALTAALGEGAWGMGRENSADLARLRSPGLLPKHYSPQAQVVVGAWRNEAEFLAVLAQVPAARDRVCVLVHSYLPTAEGFLRVALVPHDAEAYARALYAELHCCDELGAAAIVVESPPELPEWQGIADRLQRAAG